MTLASLSLMLLTALPLQAADFNWLINADFKDSGGWEQKLDTETGPYGLAACFEHSQPVWSGYRQFVILPQPAPPTLEVSSWMKTQDVKKGVNGWEMARTYIVFYGADGQRIGDWPATVGDLQGTQDWQYVSNTYRVPSSTAKVEVSLMLANATGKVCFSQPEVRAYDYDNKPLARGQAAHPELAYLKPFKSENWLLNPNLEIPGSSDWQNSRRSPEGRGKGRSLYFNNSSASWNQASQWVSFRGQKPAAIVFGGWMKTKNVVAGSEPYMKARMGLDFKDAQGKQVAGWQAGVCDVAGDSNWTYYERRYAVPEGATQVEVFGGLGNCVGEAWIDDLNLSLLDAEGKKLIGELADFQKTDTQGWYAYSPPKDPSGVALDLSHLNHQPAGAKGFVRVKDGHFSFETGERVRFWGSDIVGPNIFIEKDKADALALRLARLGVNMIRLHAADGNWAGEHSFFGKDEGDNTLTLKPSALDRYHYLFAALKKQGIYVYIDFLVSRRFKKGDGVAGHEHLEDGGKTAVHFDPRIQDLNEQFARLLLEPVNPYTGLAIKDDPAYVGSDIVNESSIFSSFGEQNLPDAQWAILQAQYKASGHKGEITRFKFDWETQKTLPTRNPENAEASLRFLYQTQLKSNLRFQAFLKKLSPHALLTCSNMGLPTLGDLAANQPLDFMDTHAYWDHPQIWKTPGGWSNAAYAPMDNQSQLKAPFKGSLLFNLLHARVEGKPFIVTEWNTCFPNEYRLEGPLLMATYGCLQDWDGQLQFATSASLPGNTPMNNFDINTRPDNEPLFQLGALIFRQGLIRPGEAVTADLIKSHDEIFANGMKSDLLYENPWLPYATRIQKKFNTQPVKLAALPPPNGLWLEAQKQIQSDTGELTLDYGRGYFTAQAPQVALAAGDLSQGVSLNAFNAKIAKRNAWAAVAWVSLDGKALGQGLKKSLFIAVARAENSGQVYTATRNALKVPGQTPVLMQGVEAEIEIQIGGGEASVSPLDSDGRAGPPLKAQKKGETLSFKISPKDQSTYYQIELKN